MALKHLLTGVTSNVNGDAEEFIVSGVRGMYGLAQCEITGAATCTLQGRLSAAYPWVNIKVFSASDAVEIVCFPLMRGVVSGYGSGAVNLSVIGGV